MTTATCTYNRNHKRFITTAHVMQEWIVDEQGNFLEEVQTLEVTHKPSAGNEWICAECNSAVTVKE